MVLEGFFSLSPHNPVIPNYYRKRGKKDITEFVLREDLETTKVLGEKGTEI